MKRLKSLAVGAGAALIVATGAVSFVAAEQSNPQTGPDTRAAATAAAATITDCRRQSAANTDGQDIFLSTATPKTYTGTAWQNVDCTATSFRLKAGQRALLVSNFNAEADCNGSAPTNGQWCQTRALINGVEGAPVAAEPSSFAFDSVAGGTSNWQAHSMGRTWELTCRPVDPKQTDCQYKFNVQTRMHDATVTGLWLDEIATHLHITYGAVAPL